LKKQRSRKVNRQRRGGEQKEGRLTSARRTRRVETLTTKGRQEKTEQEPSVKSKRKPKTGGKPLGWIMQDERKGRSFQ